MMKCVIFILIGSSAWLRSIHYSHAKDNSYSISQSDDTCEGNLTQSDGYGEVRLATESNEDI